MFSWREMNGYIQINKCFQDNFKVHFYFSKTWNKDGGFQLSFFFKKKKTIARQSVGGTTLYLTGARERKSSGGKGKKKKKFIWQRIRLDGLVCC